MTTKSYNFDEVARLADLVLHHKRLYYAGKPEISDIEFDNIERQLRLLAPSHPVLSVVGTDSPSSINSKVIHDSPMLSLGKTYDRDELVSWMGQESVVGTLKIDGTSLSLVYKNGVFVMAKTRGNGREGEDVTSKIQWVADAVPRLPGAIDVEVRGELYCTESNFVRLAQAMEQLGLERPSSPRNIVAGVLGRKLHGDLARYFSFAAFDALGLAQFELEMEKFTWLEAAGFRLPLFRLLKTHGDLDRFLDEVKAVIAEDEIGADGAVFTYNRLTLHRELGNTAHHPRYKISFKWQGETATSVIERMDWATSRLGIVTPVAVIAPVELSGARITNITLHNAAHVSTYNLKIGDEIELVRSGEVIPKFLSVVASRSGQADLPRVCPSCSSSLAFDGIRLKCMQTASCPAQKFGSILNWIVATDIEDLSEKRLKLMMDLGLVKDTADLYTLTKEDLLKLPATKDKMASKLIEAIEKSKRLSLPVFLNALGIEGVGLTTWEKICDGFSLRTIQDAYGLTLEKLVSLDGLADKSAQQIVEGLRIARPLVQRLEQVGVTIRLDERQGSQTSHLEGKVFVITGTLSRPRDEVESLIKNAGGRISSSVSAKTTALVTNDQDSTSSKWKKAQDLKVPIWSESDLLAALEE